MLEPPVAPESDEPPVPEPPVPLPPVPLPPVPLAVVLPAVPEPLAPQAPVAVALPAVPLAVEEVLDGLPVVFDPDWVPPLVELGLPGVGEELSLPHAARQSEPKIQASRMRFMSPSPKLKLTAKV